MPVGTRRRLFQFFIYYCLLISLTTYLDTDNAPDGRDNAGMFLTRHVAEYDCLLYVSLLARYLYRAPGHIHFFFRFLESKHRKLGIFSSANGRFN